MLAGPLFTREALTTPRQFKHYLIRACYIGAFFILAYTAAQTTFGFQEIRNPGEIARFGSLIFQMLTFVQLTLVLFFSVLFAAGNVAIEKDRRTLILLLMTDLRNRELVLGKLCGSLLLPAVLVAISAPALFAIYLLGGVSLDQIAASLGVCAAAGAAAGTWGTLVAFWRDKTFQTLALGLMGLVFWVALAEGGFLIFQGSPVAQLLGSLNPYRVQVDLLAPFSPASHDWFGPLTCIIGLSLLSLALTVTTILRLRVWNPSRSMNDVVPTVVPGQTEEVVTVKTREPRKVWELPVLWREMKTRAYGRRVVFMKLAFLAFAGLAIAAQIQAGIATEPVMGIMPPAGFLFVGFALLSFLLVNTQAVTAMTSERDANTLELLLVTEITAGEFTWGKLAGILYNTKELTAVPLAWLAWLTVAGFCPIDDAIFATIGFLTLTTFSAVLGLHSGLTYHNSRQAIANSLGTMFFLFVGIFICMILILQARSSFALQLPSFLVFILGGSLALVGSLAHRNQSPALFLAASILPFATFYAITTFLLGQMFEVCLAITAAYGFTVVAMLVPAVSEFDVALSAGSADRG